MASNVPPRRVSIAFLLGLGHKPYKDPKPPPPPKPSQCVKMMTTPGAVLEWAASDGRKGALTGKGRPHNTVAATPAQVPKNEKDATKGTTKSEKKQQKSKKNVTADEDGVSGGLGGLFNSANATGNATNQAINVPDMSDVPNPHNFTDEQDKKLLEMKEANASAPWADIAKGVGRDVQPCKERLGRLKQKYAAGKRQGGGEGGKKDKGKGKGKGNNNDDQNQNTANDDWGNNGQPFGGDGGTGSGDNSWSNNTGGQNNGGGGVDTTWGAGAAGAGENTTNSGGNGGGDTWGTGGFGGEPDNKSWDKAGFEVKDWNDNASKKSEKSKSGSNAKSGHQEDGQNNSWDTKNIAGGAANWTTNQQGGDSGGWDTKQSAQPNEGGGNAWDPPAGKDWNAPAAAPSKHSSHKNATKHPVEDEHHHSGSQSKHAPNHHSPKDEPIVHTLSPDSDFSLNELKFIAKFFQKDQLLVWTRLQERFFDRFGRRLSPEIFEKKVTGRVEQEKVKKRQDMGL